MLPVTILNIDKYTPWGIIKWKKSLFIEENNPICEVLLCIYVINLIYDYLTTKYTTVLLLIILGLVVIFVFLYFTYITFKILNNIVLKQAYLQKKEYKKI